MNNRVKQIREALNMSQEQFGEMIGLTKSSISNIENKSRNVTDKHVKLLCNVYNVNEKWLRFGSGDMFNRKSIDYLDKIAEYYKLDELDLKIISEYIRLDARRRGVIKDYIVHIANAISDISSSENQELLVSENTVYDINDLANTEKPSN